MNNELKPICPKKVDCENNSFNHFESANEVKYCDECNSPITDDNLCINGCHFIDKLREDYYA
jgi:hypothetical protein